MQIAKTLLLTTILLLTKRSYAQLPANFTWINIESDQKVMPLVRRALHDPSITAIREVGVEDGYALVMTVSRDKDAPIPDYDSWAVYNISLTTGSSRVLFGGYGVKLLGWVGRGSGELAVSYLTCWECEPETLLTAVRFVKDNGWQARWLNKMTNPASIALPGAIVDIGDMGAPYDDNDVDQIYAIVKQPNDGFAIGTWTHSRNTVTGKIDDDIERYSIDPKTGADRVETLTGPAARAWKREICTQSNILIQPSAGQDSKPCRAILKIPTPAAKVPN
jgi:hypothetical protein